MPWAEILKRKVLSKGRIGVTLQDDDGNPVPLPDGHVLRDQLGRRFRTGPRKPEDADYIALRPLDDAGGPQKDRVEY